MKAQNSQNKKKSLICVFPDCMILVLFATTHSLERVDALISNGVSESDQLSLLRLKTGPDGVSCRKISDSDLKNLRFELGHDVRW